jgi:hypothetical protein
MCKKKVSGEAENFSLRSGQNFHPLCIGLFAQMLIGESPSGMGLWHVSTTTYQSGEENKINNH